MIIKTVKAAWSGQRSEWRLDIRYQNAGGESKRTFLKIVDSEADQTRGEAKAEKAARDFKRGTGDIFTAFMAKMSFVVPAPPPPKPKPVKVKVTRETEPTISWLLEACLRHPEVWGRVKHSKNYRSSNAKLNAVIGDRRCDEFEAPGGRKIVVDTMNQFRSEGYSDGYVRKIMYQLRQALCALIGEGVTDPIMHPRTGKALIADVPTFPKMEKSKSRTAVLEKSHDKIVFKLIQDRRNRAHREEELFREKIGRKWDLAEKPTGTVKIGDENVWLNPRRFSSTDWWVFSDFILFLIETGCRRSEALTIGNHSLRDREVLDDRGAVIEEFQVLHLPGTVTKSGKERFINLTPPLLDKLHVFKLRAKPHSFEIGDRRVDIPLAWFALTPNQITNMWQHIRNDSLSEGVDLSAVSPHQLRHTHATRMSERGMSGKPLSDSLGHTDERTTRIYDHAQQVQNSKRFFARSVTTA